MKENYYKTGDLWLASFLITHGAKLRKFEDDQVKPDKILFCLQDEQNTLKDVADEYYRGATVPAINFKDVTLNLKHQVYRYMKTKNEGESKYGNRRYQNNRFSEIRR